MLCLVAQSCLTLYDPMDCSPPGFSVHGFSRQEYWSGWPIPSPGDLPNPRIESGFPALKADSLPAELPGKPKDVFYQHKMKQCINSQYTGIATVSAPQVQAFWMLIYGYTTSCMSIPCDSSRHLGAGCTASTGCSNKCFQTARNHQYHVSLLCHAK